MTLGLAALVAQDETVAIMSGRLFVRYMRRPNSLRYGTVLYLESKSLGGVGPYGWFCVAAWAE